MLVKRKKSAPLGKSAEIDSGSYFDEACPSLAWESWGYVGKGMETGGWWHAESSGQDSAVDCQHQWQQSLLAGSPRPGHSMHRCRSLQKQAPVGTSSTYITTLSRAREALGTWRYMWRGFLESASSGTYKVAPSSSHRRRPVPYSPSSSSLYDCC